MNQALHVSEILHRRQASPDSARPRVSALRAGLRHPFWRPASLGACLALAGFLFLAAGQSAAAVKPGAASEYQIKATFVFNFVKFTEWPSSAFTNSAAPLVIGVLGQDPFGGALDELVKDEIIHGRSLVVKRLQPGDALSDCHLLFVSRSEKDRLLNLWTELKEKPVLTVSDLDQFCQQGGMISLALSASGTVRPEINPEAARSAGVQISSKLLSLPLVRLVNTRD